MLESLFKLVGPRLEVLAYISGNFLFLFLNFNHAKINIKLEMKKKGGGKKRRNRNEEESDEEGGYFSVPPSLRVKIKKIWDEEIKKSTAFLSLPFFFPPFLRS